MLTSKEFQYVLGFMNYCSHDPGACLVKVDRSGDLIDYISTEEGFHSRRKKSYQFPLRSIKYCLDYFSIDFKDLDAICLDYMDSKRIHRTSNNYRLLIGDYIRANLDIGDNTQILFCESHHLAHAYSTFLASGLKESAILVVDGLGSEQQTHSFYKADETGVSLLSKQIGNGIGTLYALITQKIGFEAGEEGKTMGLAAYGEQHKEQDSILPNLTAYTINSTCDYSKQLTRNPSPSLKINIKDISKTEDIYSPYFTRLAYNLQSECERALIHLSKECLIMSGSGNLCLAGGVALNCVANERIAELVNNKLFVQPAAGDTGIPIGLALYGAERLTGRMPRINCSDESDFAGPFLPYTSDNSNFINTKISKGLGFDVYKYIQDISISLDIDKVCDLLLEQNVGAIYHGAIEIGPRALGHRSFIADCSDSKMKEVMNLKIKHREAYRPFAPIVLADKYSQYFSGSNCGIHSYMLGAPQCTDKAKEQAPSIVHIDGTARVQSVTKGNGLIFDILQSYYSRSGRPVLINTSFNDNNEPIVFSWLDALVCFLRTNCDFLIIENRIVIRELIEDPGAELKRLMALQDEWIEMYSLEAIRSITMISENSFPVDKFCDFNASLSNANRTESLYLRLFDFLEFAISTETVLLTDAYHYELIKKLDKVFPSSNFLSRLDFDIIEDELQIARKYLNECRSHQILLYNCSILFPSTDNNFYRKSDKILSAKILDYPEGLRSKSINTIINSYEVDRSKTIEDWFRSLSSNIEHS